LYTEQQRHAMIKILRRVPSIVLLTYSQRTGSKYAAIQGQWWDEAPPKVIVCGDGET
jgi:hypothetical protein